MALILRPPLQNNSKKSDCRASTIVHLLAIVNLETPMKLNMSGKTLLITGGNDGIGLSTALMFAEQGVNIAIFSRRSEKNEQARQKIEETGVECLALTGDVTVEDDIKNALASVTEQFGSLDYAFNNAGIVDPPKQFTDLEQSDYDRYMGINFKGVWLAMKYEIKAMLESGGGVIVNNGSIASSRGMPMLPFYSASKHAVVGLTKAAAIEFAQQKIRINAICPGLVRNTGMFDYMSADAPEVPDTLIQKVPYGRFAEPAEIASGVLSLCSDLGSYISGAAIHIDGCYTC
jgi:NAD(P)-dependent dehydrogenase (short-subunit alcohol dehydrogenase family)